MASKFAIVCDSTADLPQKFYDDHNVRHVPLHVHMGGEDYVDGITISRDEYLDRMPHEAELPRTSQPSPADFMLVYNDLINEGYTDILSLHIASALSGTCAAAQTIAQACSKDGVRIEAVDTNITTAGLAVMLAQTVLMRDEGASLDEALAAVQKIIATSRILFVPATVTNLVKGGRMSSLVGMAASLLDIKPVILVDSADGCKLTVPAKCRGMKAACSKVVKLLSTYSAEMGELAYVKLQAHSAEAMALLNQALSRAENLKANCLGALTIGPVIATHIGAHAVGAWSCAASSLDPRIHEFLSPYLSVEDC